MNDELIKYFEEINWTLYVYIITLLCISYLYGNICITNENIIGIINSILNFNMSSFIYCAIDYFKSITPEVLYSSSLKNAPYVVGIFASIWIYFKKMVTMPVQNTMLGIIILIVANILIILLDSQKPNIYLLYSIIATYLIIAPIKLTKYYLKYGIGLIVAIIAGIIFYQPIFMNFEFVTFTAGIVLFGLLGKIIICGNKIDDQLKTYGAYEFASTQKILNKNLFTILDSYRILLSIFLILSIIFFNMPLFPTLMLLIALKLTHPFNKRFNYDTIKKISVTASKYYRDVLLLEKNEKYGYYKLVSKDDEIIEIPIDSVTEIKKSL